MKLFAIALVTGLSLYQPANAQTQAALPQFEQFRPSERQIQDLTSLVLSQLPYLLNDQVDSAQLARELAPQALQILNGEQREFLQQLAPEERMIRFSEMSDSERRDYLIRQARTLVHPSQSEWLDRVNEMTR